LATGSLPFGWGAFLETAITVRYLNIYFTLEKAIFARKMRSKTGAEVGKECNIRLL
jgi:hypothetical protein